jgi:viroplasmin and RNaseH domain-containing protein
MDQVKVYGVLHGRQGSRVYDTWHECEAALSGMSSARYRTFPNKTEAWSWIDENGEPPNGELVRH